MAKNANKKSKTTIKVSKLDYEFLLQQNAQLCKQNRELQGYINGKSTHADIYDSLGGAIIADYCKGLK